MRAFFEKRLDFVRETFSYHVRAVLQIQAQSLLLHSYLIRGREKGYKGYPNDQRDGKTKRKETHRFT